jgi:hypothetical protein
MSQLITPLYNLVKTGNYMYNLHIKGDNSKPLYLSLLKTKLLTNIFYNSEENSICFTAVKIETLDSLLETQIITESLCIKMIDTLTQQIKCLESHKYAHYGHNIHEILIIDDDIFININANTLLPINEDKTITFLSPFSCPYFVSPLIKQITNLPTKIPSKEGYYSLATLVIYCLLNEELELYEDKDKDKDKLETILKPIFYTKIYWFLKHCLTQRILLLI